MVIIKENNLLGKFELTGVPLAPRGVPQIEATLSDASGILSIPAVAESTRRETKIIITHGKDCLSKIQACDSGI
ncbi:Heat shock cognate 71 kDa protein [Galemys pyrenaicus]|uniref:Heat shock cognate 71 kDa protein n=1 Tax=Galemys pyrenaicus TaxID=202257 RepID=A0A8J6AW16_GALPY|nr:Heat shock cognate 71 kDa protein [Galemys pyrenaicus]